MYVDIYATAADCHGDEKKFQTPSFVWSVGGWEKATALPRRIHRHFIHFTLVPKDFTLLELTNMSSVVGVDLGLQNSVIAAAGRGGVDVILNGNSNRLNP